MTNPSCRRALLAGPLAVLLAGCMTTPHPRRDPTETVLPVVRAQPIVGFEAGRMVTLPDDLAGRPALVLVVFDHQAQADLEAWYAELDRRGARVDLAEVRVFRSASWLPLPGTGPAAADGTAAQRRILAVRGQDAEVLAQVTGDADRSTARVLLLDEHGRIEFFEDAGFSPASFDYMVDVLAWLRS